ncbi:hypothetical protein BT96DRAFT_947636 [Gymnopus androsaceus JB14]|uniref:Uncharacterized protein n=1 Tax=Gymnopus androsaceus JB14 TaxID=1447944 RepID=A0A6A4GT98_9AGAR|nr:hypothetical protein BT96DRAFT_947636 [Gymnopus androsaceus JB14]
MVPPKLYKTMADKKAAKKANYSRYYEKHKDSINQKHCSQYAQNEYSCSKTHSQRSKKLKKNDNTKASASPESSMFCSVTASPISQKDIPVTLTLTLIVQKNMQRSLKCFLCNNEHSPITSLPMALLHLNATSFEHYSRPETCQKEHTSIHQQNLLSTLFITTDNSNEINEAWDNNRQTMGHLKKRFHVLQVEALMVGNHAAIQEGQDLLECVEEVGVRVDMTPGPGLPGPVMPILAPMLVLNSKTATIGKVLVLLVTNTYLYYIGTK